MLLFLFCRYKVPSRKNVMDKLHKKREEAEEKIKVGLRSIEGI